MKDFQLNLITNKSKVRWIKMLDFFEKNPHATSLQLAESADSSQRTVVSELVNLKEYFQDVIEISSSKHGYSFSKLLSKEYLNKKRSIVKDEPLFIILEAIFHNNLYSISEWAEKFYLSEKTMINYLAKVKKELNKFNLDLSFTPVNIIGLEVDTRYFFLLFYYESDLTPHTVLPTETVENAVANFIDLLNIKRIQPTTFSYFSYLLLIAIERAKNNLSINLNNDIVRIIKHSKLYDQLFYISQTIIENHFKQRISEEEFIYIFTSLICKRNLENVNEEKIFSNTFDNWPTIDFLVREFHNQFLYHSQNKSKDIILLESFFKANKLNELISITNLKNTNDINFYVKHNFSEEFYAYIEFLESNTNFLSVFSPYFLEDLATRLVLHIESLKYSYWEKSQNIAFIFEGNSYASQYLTSFTKSIFGAFHKLYFPYENQLNLDYIRENNIDVIATNYTDPSFEELGVDLVLFKRLPDAEDWNRLLKITNPRFVQSYNITDKD
ncbi:helix-turn-helix domain-containing protein [Enterococcus sp. NPDC086594]|uniref:helix-turn-helix domain-containing protein n=1 Tax=Enterococcus sp. NPDC086594 TaxID=3363992 RepID=UPI0037F8673A